VDHFFHLLVKDGERLKKTVHVNAVSLFDIQQHNSIETIERPETYSVNKIIWLKINGAGPVPDLKKEMSDHNVYMSPSMFNLLESYIQVSDYFDKDAIIIFTGECLGEETKEYLINKGFSVRDEMRSWDGGATFYTCRFGECHWVDYLAPTSVDDNNKLIATDLFNVAQMYVNYHNGDFVKKTTTSTCACGMVSTKNEFLNRSAFTLFKSPTGHLLNYDLIFNTFTNVGGTIPLQLCIGKYKKPIDSNIIINYITNKKVDEQLIQEEFYQTFGLKVKLENYIKPDYFKIKKIYWIDDDKLHNS
jgi:phenylacetate-coenzyme A ligase PaaK-like adenylate-forming protein